jgi:hypothetical protein
MRNNFKTLQDPTFHARLIGTYPNICKRQSVLHLAINVLHACKASYFSPKIQHALSLCVRMPKLMTRIPLSTCIYMSIQNTAVNTSIESM